MGTSRLMDDTWLCASRRRSLGSLPAFVLVLVRVGIGCVFLMGSIPKLRQPHAFLGSIYRYELVGPKVGFLVAMVLPWLELVVAICLIGGILAGGALLLSCLLGSMFVFAQGWALSSGLAISCGCFSALNPEMVSYSSFLRASFLLIAALVGYLCMLYCRPNTARYVEDPRE